MKQKCAYMYIGAGRDVWSGLGVTVVLLVGNGVETDVNKFVFSSDIMCMCVCVSVCALCVCLFLILPVVNKDECISFFSSSLCTFAVTWLLTQTET